MQQLSIALSPSLQIHRTRTSGALGSLGGGLPGGKWPPTPLWVYGRCSGTKHAKHS